MTIGFVSDKVLGIPGPILFLFSSALNYVFFTYLCNSIKKGKFKWFRAQNQIL